MKKFKIIKKFLKTEYLKKKKSMKQIAKEIKCGIRTIARYLEKYNIPRRNMSEAIKLKFKDKKYKNNYLKGREKINFKGKRNPNYKNGKPKCINCNKELSNYGYILCQDCYVLTLKGKNHPSFVDGRSLEQYYCIDCEVLISWETAINGYGHCNKCDGKYHSQRMKGKNNPNFKHGLSNEPYPLIFNSELKESIRKRDNYQCQLCDITEEEHIIVYGQILSVHHIDYNKQNCDENNLVALCISCNFRVNFNRTYWEEHFKGKIYNAKK